MVRVATWFAVVAMGVMLALMGFLAPARAHDPYRDWTNPKTGINCCHQRDCRPARAYLDPDDGLWRALLNGRWVVVPGNAVIDRKTHDGNSHICADQWGNILCFAGGVDKS